jgi:hypothetical protein
VPKDISEVVIRIGATIHMEGSRLAPFKIVFLFGLIQMNFHGRETIPTAIGIALLIGGFFSSIPVCCNYFVLFQKNNPVNGEF